MTPLEEVRKKVVRILADEFGALFRVDDDFGMEVAIRGTACFINLDERSVVLIDLYAPILRSVSLTNELFQWVATSGQDFQIGSVVLEMQESVDSGALFYRYALVGNDIDPMELVYAVSMVGYSADRLIQILQPAFGGKSYHEDN